MRFGDQWPFYLTLLRMCICLHFQLCLFFNYFVSLYSQVPVLNCAHVCALSIFLICSVCLSLLQGRTHTPTYSLFEMGKLASERLKSFAEYGDVTPLATEGQDSHSILDSFTTRPLSSGYGTSESVLFADFRRKKVKPS